MIAANQNCSICASGHIDLFTGFYFEQFFEHLFKQSRSIPYYNLHYNPTLSLNSICTQKPAQQHEKYALCDYYYYGRHYKCKKKTCNKTHNTYSAYFFTEFSEKQNPSSHTNSFYVLSVLLYERMGYFVT